MLPEFRYHKFLSRPLRSIDTAGRRFFSAYDVTSILGWGRPHSPVNAYCTSSMLVANPRGGKLCMIDGADVQVLIDHSWHRDALAFRDWLETIDAVQAAMAPIRRQAGPSVRAVAHDTDHAVQLSIISARRITDLEHEVEELELQIEAMRFDVAAYGRIKTAFAAEFTD